MAVLYPTPLQTFRKKLYSTMEALQKDLDEWIESYNNERTHQGKCAVGEHPKKHYLMVNRFGQKNLTQI